MKLKLVSLLIDVNQRVIQLLHDFDQTLHTILRDPQGDSVPSATTRPVTVTYFQLNTPGDMGNALNTALTKGYRGRVEAYQDATNGSIWHIELNGPGNPSPVSASLGDVLIWYTKSFDSMSQADFAAKYAPVP